MNTYSKLALIVAAIALGSPALANPDLPSAQWNGTWTLDTAKSTFATPAGKRSETRTYTIRGNKVTLVSKGTDAAGKAEGFRYNAAFDGKYYPMIGNPRGDSISLTLVNPRQSKAKVRKAGQPTVRATLTVSSDGKRLTLDRETLRATGAPTKELFVFDHAR